VPSVSVQNQTGPMCLYFLSKTQKALLSVWKH
jgi:hypothetical protein